MSQTTDQRARMMAVLSAAEHLVSLAPIAPYTIAIAPHSTFPGDAIGVELHFHHAPASLTAFADAMGVQVYQSPQEFGGAGFTETTASGDLDGVPFRAWTRIANPAVGQLAAPVEAPAPTSTVEQVAA